MLVPVVWFEESALIPEESARKFRSLFTERIRTINVVLMTLVLASLGLLAIDARLLARYYPHLLRGARNRFHIAGATLATAKGSGATGRHATAYTHNPPSSAPPTPHGSPAVSASQRQQTRAHMHSVDSSSPQQSNWHATTNTSPNSSVGSSAALFEATSGASSALSDKLASQQHSNNIEQVAANVNTTEQHVAVEAFDSESDNDDNGHGDRRATNHQRL